MAPFTTDWVSSENVTFFGWANFRLALVCVCVKTDNLICGNIAGALATGNVDLSYQSERVLTNQRNLFQRCVARGTDHEICIDNPIVESSDVASIVLA